MAKLFQLIYCNPVEIEVTKNMVNIKIYWGTLKASDYTLRCGLQEMFKQGITPLWPIVQLWP